MDRGFVDDYGDDSDSFADSDFYPNYLDVPPEQLAAEHLRAAKSGHSTARSSTTSPVFSPAIVPPGRAPAMIPSGSQRGKSTPTPQQRGSCSASGAWTAQAWSAGAPPSVHTSPAGPLSSKQRTQAGA